MVRSIVLGSVVLAACGDVTSNVGLELLEDSPGPEVVRLVPSVFEGTPHSDVTGAQNRLLSGYVADPVTGTVRATGYADFFVPPGTAISGAVTEAGLQVAVDYLFGDTLATVTIGVHDILEAWDEPGGLASTVLSIGEQVTTFSFAPTDSITTFLLPGSWVSQHTDALGSLDFEQGIHGLAFADISQTSVVGFASDRSILYLKTETDSVAIEISKTLTSIKRLTEPTLQGNMVLLQDGSGPSVRVDFDLRPYQGRPLNGATVQFPFEVLDAPDHFVRPEISMLQLVAVIDPEEPVVALADLARVEGNTYAGSDVSLGVFLQDVFFGDVEYAWLEVRVPVATNTIDSILLRGTDAGIRTPEAVLVFPR